MGHIDLPPPPAQDTVLISEHQGKGPWGAEAEPQRAQVHFEMASRHDAQAFATELVGPATTSTTQSRSSTSSPTTKPRPAGSVKNSRAVRRPTPSCSTRAKAAPSSSRIRRSPGRVMR